MTVSATPLESKILAVRDYLFFLQDKILTKLVMQLPLDSLHHLCLSPGVVS